GRPQPTSAGGNVLLERGEWSGSAAIRGVQGLVPVGSVRPGQQYPGDEWQEFRLRDPSVGDSDRARTALLSTARERVDRGVFSGRVDPRRGLRGGCHCALGGYERTRGWAGGRPSWSYHFAGILSGWGAAGVE